ncbi:hypothetical protein ACIFQM_18750 [Paenibacillus sp. NRS-1782]|uniref:hypothetical protein n=1 Tax=unclassified Paenibacillus TaxID=185978 RepID=UPI003D2A71D5
MKKMLSLFVVFVLFLAVLPFSANAQETNSSTINTPEDYINYLKQNNRGLNSNSQGGDDHSIILKQFTSLSNEDQQKFVDYMNNPEAIKAIFDAMQSGENTDLYNGDIKIRVDESKLKNTISPFATTYRPYAETVASALGINIITTQVYVQYRVSGGKITEILNGGGLVTRNWFPVVNIAIKEDKPYINSDKTRAYQTAYFTWNFIHSSLGAVVGVGTHTIWGFTDGSYGSSFSKS